MADVDWDTSDRVSGTNFDVPTLDISAPPSSTWRHPLTRLLAAALVVTILALTAVTFSLIVVRSTNTDLRSQLTCRSSSAVVVDFKTSQELSSIGQAQGTTLQALAALEINDQASLQQALETVPELVKSLHDTSAALDAAVAAREQSLSICK